MGMCPALVKARHRQALLLTRALGGVLHRRVLDQGLAVG